MATIKKTQVRYNPEDGGYLATDFYDDGTTQTRTASSAEAYGYLRDTTHPQPAEAKTYLEEFRERMEHPLDL